MLKYRDKSIRNKIDMSCCIYGHSYSCRDLWRISWKRKEMPTRLHLFEEVLKFQIFPKCSQSKYDITWSISNFKSFIYIHPYNSLLRQASSIISMLQNGREGWIWKNSGMPVSEVRLEPETFTPLTLSDSSQVKTAKVQLWKKPLKLI